MSIQSEKLDLIEWISKLNDTSVIEKLRAIKANYTKSEDWYADLNSEELASIEQGLKDIEEGRLKSHDSAREIFGKYL
jgi:predicted transcriptional regulator